MPLQNSAPERQTRSQAQAQVVLTPTPRAPLDGTPAVPPIKAQLDRGPIKEGAAPSRKEVRVPKDSMLFQEYLPVFQACQGLHLEVQVKMVKRRRILLKRKSLMALRLLLLLWEHLKALSHRLLCKKQWPGTQESRPHLDGSKRYNR
ncbi:hypothetical protein O181_072595 [Austropuccinia psidii MF-1]|uniref:Uncharacterized protein n=1 Tax=Austropuccinia psidii MF-1 TaxID=1389203 RepID=A0A9Q3F8Y8_9BASI|nr:hypothetical protein [Austropuccinia psidii MF-1]